MENKGLSPKESTVVVSLRLPESTHHYLSHEAKKVGLPVATAINQIIDRWMHEMKDFEAEA